MISHLQRLLLFGMLASATAWAQTQPAAGTPLDSELTQRIETNMRAHFKIRPDIKVEISPRRPSEVSGYDSVTITLSKDDKKKTIDFLLAKDGNKLAQINTIDISRDPFEIAGRPMRGAADAKVTVIVYDDFECPYCARGHKTLFTEIMPQYKDRIRVVYKDYPLSDIHPWALHAAVNANCLFAQNGDAYWDYADYVHGNQSTIRGADNRPLPEQEATLDQAALDTGKKFNLDATHLAACVKAQDESAVRASAKYGEEALGIDATPTIFVNGQRLDGAVPTEDLRKVLNAALASVGVPAPVVAAPEKPAAQTTPQATPQAPPAPAVKAADSAKAAPTPAAVKAADPPAPK